MDYDHHNIHQDHDPMLRFQSHVADLAQAQQHEEDVASNLEYISLHHIDDALKLTSLLHSVPHGTANATDDWSELMPQDWLNIEQDAQDSPNTSIPDAMLRFSPNLTGDVHMPLAEYAMPTLGISTFDDLSSDDYLYPSRSDDVIHDDFQFNVSNFEMPFLGSYQSVEMPPSFDQCSTCPLTPYFDETSAIPHELKNTISSESLVAPLRPQKVASDFSGSQVIPDGSRITPTSEPILLPPILPPHLHLSAQSCDTRPQSLGRNRHKRACQSFSNIIWEDDHDSVSNKKHSKRSKKGRKGPLSTTEKIKVAKIRNQKAICITCRIRKVSVSDYNTREAL